MKQITPKRYIQGFCLAVIILGIVRAVCPSIAYDNDKKTQNFAKPEVRESVASDQTLPEGSPKAEATVTVPKTSPKSPKPSSPITHHPSPVTHNTSPITLTHNPHRIYSVPCFKDAFPDENDVQTAEAMKKGVKPVLNRDEAERRKGELVFIGSNPYFYVDKARNSIPYLVPRASVLVQDIGKNFFDSLRVKGIPLHKIIITSAMRTKEDVEKLQKKNQNALTNSAHCYGTTVDIAYNRYKTVQDPAGPKLRLVRDDTLKWVLSEVLNDMRRNNRCYIKYEVKQGCFHLTVR